MKNKIVNEWNKVIQFQQYEDNNDTLLKIKGNQQRLL